MPTVPESLHSELERLAHRVDLPQEAIDVREAISRLAYQTDRTLAIIGGSILEDAIETSIKYKFVRLSKRIDNTIFSGYGPLSSFSAKIDIAYALNLCGAGARSDLHSIRWIRNRFAHSIKEIDFGDQQVEARCKAMHLGDISSDTKKIYIASILALSALILAEAISSRAHLQPRQVMTW
jgi:DNA-binding MltR family transcriptional regulator